MLSENVAQVTQQPFPQVMSSGQHKPKVLDKSVTGKMRFYQSFMEDTCRNLSVNLLLLQAGGIQVTEPEELQGGF